MIEQALAIDTDHVSQAGNGTSIYARVLETDYQVELLATTADLSKAHIFMRDEILNNMSNIVIAQGVETIHGSAPNLASKKSGMQVKISNRTVGIWRKIGIHTDEEGI